MKKKNYVQPELKIILVEKADIIATSGKFGSPDEIEPGIAPWGTPVW